MQPMKGLRPWQMCLALLALILALGVSGCGGGADLSACQEAQRSFLSTPANDPGLIAQHYERVKEDCGTSSHQAEKDRKILALEAQSERSSQELESEAASEYRPPQGENSAGEYARLQTEARRWKRVVRNAEAEARADFAAGDIGAAEAATTTIEHATHELERTTRAMKGNTSDLEAATRRQEGTLAQTRRENEQTERELEAEEAGR